MVGTNKLHVDEAILKLNDDDVSVRKLAINSLDGVNDESAIEPLIKATNDENAIVRFGAAEILGNMGETVVDRLLESFTNESGLPRRFIASALQKTGSEKVISYFAEAVTDDDFGVRKIALRTLGELQATDKLDVIKEGLNDEDGGVRVATIYALGDLATGESIQLIKDARRNEKDKDFKKHCGKALKKADKIKKAGGKMIASSKAQPLSTIKEMEKVNVEDAIKAYKVHVDEKSSSDVPYKRLAILYRKLCDLDNEIDVLNKAITILSEAKPGKEAWFQKRLDKLN